MDTADAALSILLFVGLLVMNMIFYGFGVAIQNLNISDVEALYEQNHDKKSKRILKVSKGITKYVNTVQVVVTLAQLIMGGFFLRIFISVARGIFRQLTDAPHVAAIRLILQMVPVFLAFVFLGYILLLVGVMIPKKIAAIYPEKWAYACVSITYAFCFFLTPVTSLIDVSANGLLRLFGIRQPRDEGEVTEEEIISMVNEGHEQGVLEESEAEMITNIFEYGDKTVRDIMTNRQNIKMLDAQMRLSDAVAFMLEENNSRYPVFSETSDQIIGFLHLKDACRYQHKLRMENEKERSAEKAADNGAKNHGEGQPDNAARPHGEKNADRHHSDPRLKSCRSILRRPEFVPETMNIDDLFHSMQSKHLQMVIVADEYGQTVGLVTMEDILEEIVGNIQDEYDEEDRFIIKTGRDRFVADGMTPLEELTQMLGIPFDEGLEVDTLNGFMIMKMEHVPEEKERFSMEYGGYEFQIRQVEKRVIRSVLLTKKEPQPEEKKVEENADS
ncbi:MAG: hemolysin family protein [Clostridium sp.]|nr:hemolysin family protein [Clostridium sp.]